MTARGVLLGWTAVWAPILAIAALHALIRGSGGYLLHLLILVLVGGGLLLSPPRLARVLVLAFLVFGSASLVVEWWAARTTWGVPGADGALDAQRVRQWFAPVRLIGVEGAADTIERRWATPEGSQVHLAFDARQIGGDSGWAWVVEDPGFVVEPLEGVAPGTSRVVPPPGGGSFVTRRRDTGSPVAGRTFRVLLDLRLAEPYAATESACRGVILREARGSGARACFAASYGVQWGSYGFEWTVADSAVSNVLAIELRFPVSAYEVGQVRLEERTAEGWSPLGPLEPTGLLVSLAVAELPTSERPTAVLLPGSDWETYTLDLDLGFPPAGAALRVLINPETGAEFEVRNVRVTAGPDGEPLAVRGLPERVRGAFEHPNLAGHVLAVLGTIAAGMGTGPAGLLAALGAATVGVALTGSRTGMFGLAIGIAQSVGLGAQGARRSRRSLPAFAWVVVAVAAGWLLLQVTGRDFGMDLWRDLNAVSRDRIFSFAWDLIHGSPWTGLSHDGLAERWIVRFPEATETPVHAHNLWLQWGVRYGWPGLLAAVWTAIALARFAWRVAGSRGAAVVLVVLAMQFTDFSLETAPVFAALALALAACRRPSGKGEATTATPQAPGAVT